MKLKSIGIYAVTNNWLSDNLTSEDDLYNDRGNLIIEGDEEKAELELPTSKGRYINFYDKGEKLISTPKTQEVPTPVNYKYFVWRQR